MNTSKSFEMATVNPGNDNIYPAIIELVAMLSPQKVVSNQDFSETRVLSAFDLYKKSKLNRGTVQNFNIRFEDLSAAKKINHPTDEKEVISAVNKLETMLAENISLDSVGTDAEEFTREETSIDTLRSIVVSFIRGFTGIGDLVRANTKLPKFPKLNIHEFGIIPTDVDAVDKLFKSSKELKPWAFVAVTLTKWLNGRGECGDDFSLSLLFNELAKKIEGDNKDDADVIIDRIRNLVINKKLNPSEVIVTEEVVDTKSEAMPSFDGKAKKTNKQETVAAKAQIDTKVVDDNTTSISDIIKVGQFKLPKKPNIVKQHNDVVPEMIAKTKEEEKEPIDLKEVYTDEAEYGLLEKYPYLMDIADTALQNNCFCRFLPECDKDGVIRIINVCTYSGSNSVFSKDKSFTVDMGNVIDNVPAIWPTFINDNFIITQIETCNEGYRITNVGKFNKSFFDKLFKVGFTGLSKNDKKPCYSADIISANKHIVYISRPKDNNRDLWKDAIIKTSRADIFRNELRDFRYEVIAHDDKDMTLTLSNRNMLASKYYMSNVPQSPSFDIRIYVILDSDGKPVKLENGYSEFTFHLSDENGNFPDSTVVREKYAANKAYMQQVEATRQQNALQNNQQVNPNQYQQPATTASAQFQQPAIQSNQQVNQNYAYPATGGMQPAQSNGQAYYYNWPVTSEYAFMRPYPAGYVPEPAPEVLVQGKR